MWLGDDEENNTFTSYLLQVGSGQASDNNYNISIPAHMRCSTDIQSLITALDLEIVSHQSEDLELSLPGLYFLDRMILSAKNTIVNKINSQVLTYFPGQATTFTSADSVIKTKFDYISAEMLHTLEPSRFP